MINKDFTFSMCVEKGVIERVLLSHDSRLSMWTISNLLDITVDDGDIIEHENKYYLVQKNKKSKVRLKELKNVLAAKAIKVDSIFDNKSPN